MGEGLQAMKKAHVGNTSRAGGWQTVRRVGVDEAACKRHVSARVQRGERERWQRRNLAHTHQQKGENGSERRVELAICREHAAGGGEDYAEQAAEYKMLSYDMARPNGMARLVAALEAAATVGQVCAPSGGAGASVDAAEEGDK